MSSKTCIVVAGPTAVGKTSMAIQLAVHFNTSIISADSRQCYRELNIGVAKPDERQLAIVKHYFINSHSIFEDVNAVAFETYALQAAAEIFKSCDVAIVAGGTGLYLKALMEGIDDIPAIPMPIRNEVISEYEKSGLNWLQKEIERVDPEYFKTGEIYNPQRMMRALEVLRATGKSITSFHSSLKKARHFNIIKTALQLPRETLNNQINERVGHMMESGLVEEVKRLLPYEKLNALQTVGYKEIFSFLHGATQLSAAVESIKSNTRSYAKRQMTWFRKDEEIQWFHPADFEGLLSYVQARKSTRDNYEY